LCSDGRVIPWARIPRCDEATPHPAEPYALEIPHHGINHLFRDGLKHASDDRPGDRDESTNLVDDRIALPALPYFHGRSLNPRWASGKAAERAYDGTMRSRPPVTQKKSLGADIMVPLRITLLAPAISPLAAWK